MKPARTKVYRYHYCTKKHRSFSTAAKCLWPKAHWITGEGSYALLARCNVLTVTLHQATRQELVNPRREANS